MAECAGITEIEPSQRIKVNKLVDKILADQPPLPGLTRLTKHYIYVTDPTPLRHKLRRMSPKMFEIATKGVERLFNEGIIEPSASDYSSTPVLIKKQDGTYRFCIDLRDVNSVTRKDAYPMKNMDTTFDRLGHAKYLTKIDLRQAYFQIALAEDGEKFTAFRLAGSGLWQFTRMTFGLSNALMTLQRLLDILFRPKIEPYVFNYLDDLVIATKTFEEHLYSLELVLRRLNEAGLVINKAKCEFCCSRIHYLGFMLDKEGLLPDPEKVAPVVNFPAPKTVKQLRRFLGMVGWYSRFFDKDSEHKIPLVKLLRKGQNWVSGEEQQGAFE